VELAVPALLGCVPLVESFHSPSEGRAMSVDAYAVCPCGSGKKVKFCCCKDLLHDLDKVIRMVKGEQFVAAVELIDRIIAESGPRPGLLALHAEANMALDNTEECARSVAQLLAAVPHSQNALAMDAMLAANAGDSDRAIERLQDALESMAGNMLPTVYFALGAVAMSLIHQNRILAGRGHLLFQAALMSFPFCGSRSMPTAKRRRVSPGTENSMQP
jgi:hypothetical protein